MESLKENVGWKVSRLLLLLSLVVVFGFAVGLKRPKLADDETMASMGLNSGELVTVDQVSKSEMAFKMNGHDYMMDYRFISMRSEKFKLMVQSETGELVETEAPPVSTIRGTLRGVEGSQVTGCMTEEGCCALIEMPTGENCFIQPADNPALPGVHVVYDVDDVVDLGLQCGCITPIAEANDEEGLTVQDAADVANLRQCETIVDADFEYYSIFGSVSATNARMEMLLNIANRQYESEVDIRLTVSSSIVRSSANDPYTSSDGGVFIDEVQDYYTGTSITGDVCHVFTGKDDLFRGTTRINGIARFRGTLANRIPSICTEDGIGISKHQSALSNHAATLAHEIGHNFSLPHCNCPGHTMNTSSSGALDFHNTISVPPLAAARDSLTCLSRIGPIGFGLTGSQNNDDFIDAIRISGLNFTVSGSNTNATTQSAEEDLRITGSTVWCYVDANANGTLTIDSFGSDFDTQLHVYESVPGSSLAGLELVANNDDTRDPTTGSLRQSRVTFDVTAGNRYQIRTGGFRSSTFIGPGSEGNIRLNGSFTVRDEGPCGSNVQILNGELVIRGTQGPDNIVVTQVAGMLVVDYNQQCMELFDVADVSRVFISGFGGADFIQASVSVPTLLDGGFGADEIIGGNAVNDINGGPGADLISGGPQNDMILAGRGQDTVFSFAGDDTLIGGDAADHLVGGQGNDILMGGLGFDTLIGNAGNDVLTGNAGADTLDGGPDDDELSGLGGSDSLSGGSGDDVIRGGAGFDTINGGPGVDVALDRGEIEISIEN